jgi:hypothetical protein
MASTGVFVRVVCALKKSISSFSTTQSMILTYKEHTQTAATKKWALREIFTRGGNAQNKQNANRNSGRFDKIEYIDD